MVGNLKRYDTKYTYKTTMLEVHLREETSDFKKSDDPNARRYNVSQY